MILCARAVSPIVDSSRQPPTSARADVQLLPECAECFQIAFQVFKFVK